MRRKVMTFVLASAICLALALSLHAGSAAGTSPGTSMPGVSVLDSLVDKYEAVRFDHAMHTNFAEGCGSCHHQHGSGGDSCKTCHALESGVFKNAVVTSFLACKSCHGQLNPKAPEIPSLKVAYHQQCFGCHGTMGRIGLDPKGCTEQCHAARGAR